MQLLINAAIAGSFAALMAAGLSLVYGVLGVFNMALGQLALVGGYLTWWAYAELGLPFIVSLGIGITMGALVSWLSFELFVGPYYKRHRFLPLVTTIALSMILDGVLLILFEEQPRSVRLGTADVFHIGTAVISSTQVILILATVVFLLVLAWIVASTSIGRKIRATVQHSAAAESLGMNAAVLHRAVFIVSGVLAGLAGVYQGIDQNLTPTLGFAITIKAYAALIAGGKNSMKGTILCAYLIALLEQIAVGIPLPVLGTYIPAGYQGTTALVVIICILLWKPQGIFGFRTRAS